MKNSVGLGEPVALAWLAPCSAHHVIHEEVDTKPGKGEFSKVEVQMAMQNAHPRGELGAAGTGGGTAQPQMGAAPAAPAPREQGLQ